MSGRTMHYVLLLYASELEEPTGGESGSAQQRARDAFAAELSRTKLHRLAPALGSSTSATTVRLRGGHTLLHDGPCAAAREQLLGLLLIEARDLDEAIAVAVRAPDARAGAVEIRPLREPR